MAYSSPSGRFDSTPNQDIIFNTIPYDSDRKLELVPKHKIIDLAYPEALILKLLAI